MTDKKLIDILSNLTQSTVFFGPQGFNHVATEDELIKAQFGFGVNDLGQAIVSDNSANDSQGCWQSSWRVFARDTELGDPYFVDLTQASLPVYTGFLAENGWQIELVATSLVNYVRCMELLFKQGEQSQAQFFPDQNTITEPLMIQNLQQQLINSAECQQFWQIFMQGYSDWLIED